MKKEDKTPVMTRGSGTFLRDQTTHSIRQEMDTMRECPAGCTQGRLRTVEETGMQYVVLEEDCLMCGGTGVVPKYKLVAGAR